jgi:hypothetical protein
MYANTADVRVDPATVHYDWKEFGMEAWQSPVEYTVSDPKTWARPWSVEAPLARVGPPIYEFACHEQNYGLINVIRGAQIREAEARERK